MHIIIIGAGIGGLCLAQGLKKAGISFSVYERNADPESWLEGYRLHLSPVGSKALFQCLPSELANAFIAGTGDATNGFGFLTENLEELVHIDEELMVGKNVLPQNGQYAISRKVLRIILMAGIQNHIHFGKKFVRFEQLPNGQITAIFEDGTSCRSDLLIGADGSNSTVRKQFLPQAERLELDAVALAGRTLLTEHSRAWIPKAISSRMNVIMPSDKYFFFTAAFDNKEKLVSSRETMRKISINASLNPEALFDENGSYILWSFICHKKELVGNTGREDVRSIVFEKIKKWHPDLRRLVSSAAVDSLCKNTLKNNGITQTLAYIQCYPSWRLSS